MHIGIEVDRSVANPFGIGRFVRETVQALQADFPDHDYSLLRPAWPSQAFRRPLDPRRVVRGARRVLWSQTTLPRQARQRGIDVLFCPDYLAPVWPPCAVVTAVHDVLFQRHPQWGEPLVNWQLRVAVPLSLRRSARIVVPSQWVKQELLTAFRCAAERIAVIPEGVGPPFQPCDAERVRRTLTRYGLDGTRFILSVGTWSPRKNLIRLLRAFATVRSADARRLVLLGGGRWSDQPLRRAIRALALEGRVVLAGFVPDADLPAFYSGAEFFVLPSLYEGFGLPVLEAMACGCPVVASRAAAIPEVTDGAAVLVDPCDEAAWAEAMRAVTQDQGQREQLRQLGFRRARAFSWSRTARQLEQVFQEVVDHEKCDTRLACAD